MRQSLLHNKDLWFRNEALPRFDTASSIKFVFVETSLVLQEKTELGWGMTWTSALGAKHRATTSYKKKKSAHLYPAGTEVSVAFDCRSSGLLSVGAPWAGLSELDDVAGGAARAVAAGEGWGAAGAVFGCEIIWRIEENWHLNNTTWQ